MKNKHFWFMLACCLLPLGGLTIAWFLGVPLGTLGVVVLLLACPLGHLLLMRNMSHANPPTQATEASRDDAPGKTCSH